jgi:hypothetical protein
MAAIAAPEPWFDEERRARTFTLGLDLGQAADFSALTVLERYVQPLREVDPQTGDQATAIRYEIRHLMRYPLGSSYSDVVANVAQLMRSQELLRWVTVKARDGNKIPKLLRPALVIDATGVGRPVVDEFRKAGLAPIGVTITGGDSVTRDGRFWHVPKRNLVSSLVLVFQNRTLKIAPSLPLAATLATEVQNFKRKIDLRTAHDSFEAWRDSMYDDLVLACSLALWWAQEQSRLTFAKVSFSGF